MALSSNTGVDLAEGEAFATYAATDERWPCGTIGHVGSGRLFRFAKAGGATLVIGNVIQAAAPVANHVNLTAVATAIGATTIDCALGATAAVIDQYKDGYVSVSVTPGAGQVYVIKTHPANAGSATLTVTLQPGAGVRVALTTTSRIDLITNPYRGVIQAPVTTLTAQVVGVAVSAPTTTKYCWIQTRGIASVLTSGTVIIGEQVISPAGAAGAVGPNSGGGSETESIVGRVARVAATTAWSSIDLSIL